MFIEAESVILLKKKTVLWRFYIALVSFIEFTHYAQPIHNLEQNGWYTSDDICWLAYCKTAVTPLLKHWSYCSLALTYWRWVTHICVGNLMNICSDNGLSPGRRQAFILTNAVILFFGPLGTNFSEISIKILTFSLKKMRLKVSSAKWRPFCLGLNVFSTPMVPTCAHGLWRLQQMWVLYTKVLRWFVEH